MIDSRLGATSLAPTRATARARTTEEITTRAPALDADGDGEPPLVSAPGDTPPPMSEADLVDQIATLLVRAGKADRKLQFELRASEEAAAKASDEKEVAELHDKAHMAMVTGITEGLCTAGSGAVSLGTAAANASDVSALGHTTNARDVSAFQAQIQERSTWSAGASKLIEATGQGASGIERSAAENDEANAKQAENEGARARRASDDHKAAMNDADTLIQKTLDFLREAKAGERDAQAAAIHRA